MSYLEMALKVSRKQSTETVKGESQPERIPDDGLPVNPSDGLARVQAHKPEITIPPNITRPSNWRELLSSLGYEVKAHRATCPFCPPKPDTSVSITAWGVNCFRDRSHSRPWSALINASAVPATFAKAPTKQQRVTNEEADKFRRILAREAAASEWTFAKPAPENHQYLLAKHVPPMGARIDAAGKLLVPVYGLGRMEICEILFSLERIAPDGHKRFEADCRVKGGYCFVRPDWESVDSPRRLGPIPEPHPERVWICEGFATAATVVLATNEFACCVFSAGNLGPALEVLTRRMRAAEFIIAADNDRQTPGNPGRKAALEAAERFHLRVALPEFPEGAQGSDWNDLAAMLDGSAAALTEGF